MHGSDIQVMRCGITQMKGWQGENISEAPKNGKSGHEQCRSYCWPVQGKPEDHWSCIAHLSAEDMLKSAVIEEKKFKHTTRVGADNPLKPKF